VNGQIGIFLPMLFSTKPADLYILLWTLNGKHSRWFKNLEEAVEYARSMADHDLYVGVGLSPEDFGPMRRCISSRIAGLVGFWLDIDFKSGAHPRAALPSSADEALSLLPPTLPASLVIQTGNGLHFWWLFREPLIFESDRDRDAASQLATGWQTLFRLTAAARGWGFERLSDLARVLRVPGTVNNKDPRNPKPVTILSQTDHRYDPTDFEELLRDSGVTKSDCGESAAPFQHQSFTSTGLVIDPQASLPEDLLAGLISADMRFRNTWNRQRHDLKDQSQSGYDLALADFGYQAGLVPQQIVDMIIHHRRLHMQRPRSRVDYYQRTLARAAWPQNAHQAATLAPSAADEGKTLPAITSGEAISTPPEPAITKALLCERLSKALGIRIVRIVKITGKEPTYQIQLETGRIEFANVGKLISQGSLRMAIASAVDRLIPKFRPKDWEDVAQMILDALTVAEGGEETDLAGAARLYVRQYLSETAFIDDIEDQPVQTLRKPCIVDGQIAICASDLQPYINKTFARNYTVQAVASMLAAIDATNVRVRGARFKEQSRWILPRNEFEPLEYAPHIAAEVCRDGE
jgi:hypothetical protein